MARGAMIHLVSKEDCNGKADRTGTTGTLFSTGACAGTLAVVSSISIHSLEDYHPDCSEKHFFPEQVAFFQTRIID